MKAVEIIVPSDKSISHRAVMLASISKGATRIKNLLMAEDIKRTIEAFQAMGVKIKIGKIGTATIFKHGKNGRCPYFIVHGVGMRGLKKPSRPLYLGNSGTTMRVLPGILAGQDFEVVLTGDKSLSARPMKRIVEPLVKMGAAINGQRSRQQEIYPPLKIRGGRLKAIQYKSTIASAQVKSCILLAGLYADGVTCVSEPEKSRDHTERMLKMFGCRLKAKGSRISLKGPVELKSPGAIGIPGDISSAAFFIVAGCILLDTKITIRNVGLNPSRTGILDILKKMGADIRLRESPASATYGVGWVSELMGDIMIKPSKLRGVTISSKEVVRAIDEIPVIMVAACFAKGKTVIKGIEELRVKETDRIKSMVTNLRKIGADIGLKAEDERLKGRASGPEPEREHIVINGGMPLHSAKVSSFGDHRTAMSMLIAGLGIKGNVRVTGLDCINKSFPGFERLLHRLSLAGSS